MYMKEGIVEKQINIKKGLYLVNIIEEIEEESCCNCPIKNLCKKKEKKIVVYSNKLIDVGSKVSVNIIEKNEAKSFGIIFLIPLVISLIISIIVDIIISSEIITGITFIVSIFLIIIIISKIAKDRYIAVIE